MGELKTESPNERRLMLYEHLGDELLLYEETEDEDLLFEPHLDYEYHNGKITGWQNINLANLLTVQWVTSQDFTERLFMNVSRKYNELQKYRLCRFLFRVMQICIAICAKIYSMCLLPPFLIRCILTVDTWVASFLQSVLKRRGRHDKEAVVIGRLRQGLVKRYGVALNHVTTPINKVRSWWYGSECKMYEGKKIGAEIIIEDTSLHQFASVEQINYFNSNEEIGQSQKNMPTESFFKRGVVYIISLPKASFGLLYSLITNKHTNTLKEDDDTLQRSLPLAEEMKACLSLKLDQNNQVRDKIKIQDCVNSLEASKEKCNNRELSQGSDDSQEIRDKQRTTRSVTKANEKFKLKNTSLVKKINLKQLNDHKKLKVPQECERFVKKHGASIDKPKVGRKTKSLKYK